MEPVVKPEPPDTLDRDRFREMLESAAFRRYAERLGKELVRLMNDCERLDEPRDIYRAQGAAQIVEAVLRLPQVILQEMEPRPLAHVPWDKVGFSQDKPGNSAPKKR